MSLRRLLPLLLASTCLAQSFNGVPGQIFDVSHVNGVPGQSIGATSVNGIPNQFLQGAVPLFSPTPGTYSTTQTVTGTCPGSQSLAYTLDGSTPTIASTLYTGPLTVSATTTVKGLCFTPGTNSQNAQASSANWKCVTVNGGTSNGLTCQSGGGVGSIQPSAWAQTYGSTMTEGVSTTSSTGTTQMLFVNTGAASDSSTYIAEHLVIQPNEGPTYLLNNEMDIALLDATHNKEIMCGLQANQQAGILQWQYANTGSWVNSGITSQVPLSTTAPTTVDYTCHRVIGDTGCGGLGCNYYDTLAINGVSYTLGATLESAALPGGWTAGVVGQQQPDLTNTTTSGANPTSAGYTITAFNVTSAIGPPSAVTSATYTISSLAPAFSATPTSVAEGSILTNTTAYYTPVTVTNTGTANLIFSAIGFAGTNASDFSVTSGFSPSVNPVGGNTLPACSTSTPVAPSASCIVPIDFVPGAAGSRSGSLQFTDNAPGSPHTVTITGTGTTATGTVLPACGSMLSANTTYYATGNITCNDAGFGLNGTGITVNLNGYTLTCGQSPSTTLVGRPCFYNAAGYANPLNLTSCTQSGAAYNCYSGITATTNNGGNEVIENGTIDVAGGATSAATMQYTSAAVFSNESGNAGSGDGWQLHDLTVNIPVNCTSCWAYSSWPGDYGTGPGDKIWKVTVNDNSGFVYSRCSYEGTAFNLSYYSSTTNPGAIAYENTVNHSPQDGFSVSTNNSFVFGNTLKIGNPNGTIAGTAATCSGIGTGTYGTESANDFAVEVTGNSIATVNNTIDNYEGRGIDLSSPNGGTTNSYTDGNSIITTAIPNYVEYQGCEIGGSYGERQKFFGYTNVTGIYSSNENITVTTNQCPAAAYSQSDNSSNTNYDQLMILTNQLASGHAALNAPAFQDTTNADGNPAPYVSYNMTVTSDTGDVFFGDMDGSLGGVWTCVDCTFNKPSTFTTGNCQDSALPEPSWVVFQVCSPPGDPAATYGPLYIVNPTFTGGAAMTDNDFTYAASEMASGSVATIYLQYPYQVTVTGATTGNPISGATVTATDTLSGLECTATTNSSGVAICNGLAANSAANASLNNTKYSFIAPSAPVTTTFNPFTFSISKSGCTTNGYSESISGPTTEAKTLGGC